MGCGVCIKCCQRSSGQTSTLRVCLDSTWSISSVRSWRKPLHHLPGRPIPPSCSIWGPCCSPTISLKSWRSRFWIWCRWTWWYSSMLCCCTSLHVHSGPQLWPQLWAVIRLVQQQSAAGGSSAASVGGTSKLWPGSYQKAIWASLSRFVSSPFGCLYSKILH